MNDRQQAVAHTKAQRRIYFWVTRGVPLALVLAVALGLYLKFREQPTIIARDFWEVTDEWHAQGSNLTHRAMEIWSENQKGDVILAPGFVHNVSDATGPLPWSDYCRVSLVESVKTGFTLSYGDGLDTFKVSCDEIEDIKKNEYVEVLCELTGEDDYSSDPRTEDCEVLP